MDFKVAASALESVPGRDARGRICTSNVACDGDSEFGLTSMGPEREASEQVSPSGTHKLFSSWISVFEDGTDTKLTESESCRTINSIQSFKLGSYRSELVGSTTIWT